MLLRKKSSMRLASAVVSVGELGSCDKAGESEKTQYIQLAMQALFVGKVLFVNLLTAHSSLAAELAISVKYEEMNGAGKIFPSSKDFEILRPVLVIGTSAASMRGLKNQGAYSGEFFCISESNAQSFVVSVLGVHSKMRAAVCLRMV